MGPVLKLNLFKNSSAWNAQICVTANESFCQSGATKILAIKALREILYEQHLKKRYGFGGAVLACQRELIKLEKSRVENT